MGSPLPISINLQANDRQRQRKLNLRIALLQHKSSHKYEKTAQPKQDEQGSFIADKGFKQAKAYG